MTSDFKIDTTAFNRMCRQMADLTCTPFEQIVQYEAAKVLEGAAAKTTSASISKIKSADEKMPFKFCPVDMYLPKVTYEGRGGPTHIFGSARRVVSGMVNYCLSNRYPDLLWSLIQDNRLRSVKAKIGARGLSKKSWWELGKTFGVQIKIPAYAKKAKPSDGKEHPGNVHSTKTGAGAQFTLHVVNSQPTVNNPGVGGSRVIQVAITGRAKYFERNVCHKVFESVAAVAKKYPGVKVAA